MTSINQNPLSNSAWLRRLPAIQSQIQINLETELSLRINPWLRCSLLAHEKLDKAKLKAKKEAVAIVETFLKTARAQNIPKLTQLTDVPWYEDGTRIIRERANLKKLLKSMIRAANNPRFNPKVLGAARFGKIGEPFHGERLSATQVVGKDDWVVFVGEDRSDFGQLYVRIRNGIARVVGNVQ